MAELPELGSRWRAHQTVIDGWRPLDGSPERHECGGVLRVRDHVGSRQFVVECDAEGCGFELAVPVGAPSRSHHQERADLPVDKSEQWGF